VRVLGAAALGFVIGVNATSYVQTTIHKDFDRDIIAAFDKRFATTVLNSTGFGDNYVNRADNSEEMLFKKPY
jgi:hypothetical protein